MDIREVTDGIEKQRIARSVLESLTDWFGIPEARESYIRGSAGLPFVAAYDGGLPVGFICLKETGRATAELCVMGVLKEYHRNGVGTALFNKAKALAKSAEQFIEWVEHDIITLRFHEKGAPDIHYNCFTPGSSAGNYGGGEYAKELTKDFYAGCTVEQFAGNFPERLHDKLMANEMLRRFLDAANRRRAKKS